MMDNIYPAIASVFVLIGAIHIGRNISVIFPSATFDVETREAVNRGLVLITTLTALVLGLLVTTGKAAFDKQNETISEMVSEASVFDEMLFHYGTDSNKALHDFRSASRAVILSLWDETFEQQDLHLEQAARNRNQSFIDDVVSLPTPDDRSKFFKDKALTSAIALIKARYRLTTLQHSVIPAPMLLTIVIWLACIFTSLGFCSPGNMTSLISEYVGAMCASAAILLIVELDHPFTGIIQISRVPASMALKALGG